MDNLITGISVLVCTYNGGEKLAQTLRHLRGQRLESTFPWEVIVIDNASTDNTYAMVKQMARDFTTTALTLVQEERPGKTYALETGFSLARYSHLLVCDDDNWLAPDYLEIACQVVRDTPGLGVLGGTSEAVPEVEPPAWFWPCSTYYATGSQADRSGDVTESRGWVYGAGMVVNKAVWQKMNEYQYQSVLTCRRGATISGGEDVEMCLVARLLGFRIVVDNRLQFKHFIPKDRLTWAYFRKLQDGSARANAFLQFFNYFSNSTALQTNPLQTLYAQTLKKRVGVLRKNGWAFLRLLVYGMGYERTDLVEINWICATLKTMVSDKNTILEQLRQVQLLQQRVYADYRREHQPACAEGQGA